MSCLPLTSFQTTLSVLAKGDLQEEYDVPWRACDAFSPTRSTQGLIKAPMPVESLFLERTADT